MSLRWDTSDVRITQLSSASALRSRKAALIPWSPLLGSWNGPAAHTFSIYFHRSERDEEGKTQEEFSAAPLADALDARHTFVVICPRKACFAPPSDLSFELF